MHAPEKEIVEQINGHRLDSREAGDVMGMTHQFYMQCDGQRGSVVQAEFM
jgi:hypothetical protein